MYTLKRVIEYKVTKTRQLLFLPRVSSNKRRQKDCSPVRVVIYLYGLTLGRYKKKLEVGGADRR